jgi:hypothetical protein
MKTHSNIINVPLEVQVTYKDLIAFKELIQSETKNVSGIYGFKNDLSEDSKDLYIGSAIDISKRFNQHFIILIFIFKIVLINMVKRISLFVFSNIILMILVYLKKKTHCYY